jgi:hypothetical protein
MDGMYNPGCRLFKLLSHCFSSVMPMCNAVRVLYTFQKCKSHRLCRFGISAYPSLGVGAFRCQPSPGPGGRDGRGTGVWVHGLSSGAKVNNCNSVLSTPNDGWLCGWAADSCLSLLHAD